MKPSVSVPNGWEYPRFTFGQRTERGMLIGMSYYPKGSLLASEYGEGWRYAVMIDNDSIDEENRLEEDVKLLTPEELAILIHAEIEKRLKQIDLLRQELQEIPLDRTNS